jgi:hypothetical protein
VPVPRLIAAPPVPSAVIRAKGKDPSVDEVIVTVLSAEQSVNSRNTVEICIIKAAMRDLILVWTS